MLWEKKTYKYSRILEADNVKQAETREKIKKEYPRTNRKLLETNLCNRKLIKGINTWACPYVRYSGPCLEELKLVDQRTRKQIMLQKALTLTQYISRKEGRRGLASIEDSVNASIQRPEDYVEKRGGRLITATRNNVDNTRINKTNILRKRKWEEKQHYGYFKRQTSDISHEKTWTWLRKGNLKRENESLLIGVQNNAIRISYIKARIDRTQQNSKYGLGGDRDETNDHIISECRKLAQKEYNTRYD